MALINSAESQGFGFLFVSVPETDQHKKQKSGERKGDQANQNATNHSCLLPLYVAGRLRIRTSSRPSCCSAASTARALNVAITADYWSGVASTMERRRLYPRFRCGGSDHRRLLAGRHPRP